MILRDLLEKGKDDKEKKWDKQQKWAFAAIQIRCIGGVRERKERKGKVGQICFQIRFEIENRQSTGVKCRITYGAHMTKTQETQMKEIAVVNILLNNLSKQLYEDNDDLKLISGSESEFRDLLDQVRRLNACLLYVADIKRHRLRKELMAEIPSVIYRIEDVIDKLLVKRMLIKRRYYYYIWPAKRLFIISSSRRNKVVLKSASQIIKDLLGSMVEPPDRERLALPSGQKFVLVANVLGDALSKTVHQQSPKSIRVIRFRVVGFDEEAEKLIKRLIEGPEDPDVVPIVGMVGLGKTTLAKQIYCDSRISEQFKSTFWINVGQFELKDICLSILERLGSNVEYEDMDVRELAKIICGILAESGGRCLFVLDKVWTSEVVDLFKIIFPKNKKGHRILMTTRIGYVATYANEDPHYLKYLSRDESSELLIERCGGKHTSFSEELVEIGKRIAEQCSGVPLLLATVAHSLRFHREIHEGKLVEGNVMKRFMDKGDQLSIYPFVKESYNSLTKDMKLCFLHLGVFPLNFQIPAQKLIRLWIAECLIKSDSDFDSISLEERAEICLNALVDRNLVIVMRKRLDGKIKTCRVHELLHAFCKVKAEKWLFKLVSSDTVTEGTVNIAETTRRLCIQSTVLKNFLSRKPVAKHVRSFYCFHSEQSQMGLSDSYSQLIHKAFPLLRVLEIGSLNSVFSKDFNQLYHLKYISIKGDFKALPEAFGKFWNLQTLLINTTTSEPTLEIEASIWNLLQLRHLHTNIPANLLPSPNPTGKDSCLQNLSVVAPESCTIDVFAKAFNLKKLGIRGNMEAFLNTAKGEFSNLEDIRCLEHLKLYNDGSNKLHLPPSFKFLSTLKKLTLSGTMFDWSDANILGQLGSLEVLKLKEGCIHGEILEGGERRFQSTPGPVD
ncbi:putative late blight resistance protein homolog R1A-10 [Lycium ferocissimum]|uniref:putative late blight resistance protein homolog R1A-10 n=1 Tax=Lycium ferocissimum TaxID=112874 RepID=UPI00281622FF|nr:putative late blight resistance protein homolog R1A-10 [Lycium ferocissimum]